MRPSEPIFPNISGTRLLLFTFDRYTRMKAPKYT